MFHLQRRMQILYFFLVLGCAAILMAGCDLPSEEWSSGGQGEGVETEYSDSMLDNGTPMRDTPREGVETWASSKEPDSYEQADSQKSPPVKPSFDLNAGTGSDDQSQMKLRDEALEGETEER